MLAAVLHIVDDGAVNGAVVDADVAALNGVDDIAHVVAAIGASRSVLSTLSIAEKMRRQLRALNIRYDAVAVHAHGPVAWRIASMVADVVIVDDGDEGADHRLFPAPSRRVFACHADLDRGLERGTPQRQAALAPPGVDVAVSAGAVHDGVVVAAGVTHAHVDVALARAGVNVRSSVDDGIARVVVGRNTPLTPAIGTAIAAGVPVFSLGALWRDEFEGFKHIVDVADIDDLVRAVAATPIGRRRRIPKALGRAARTAELGDIYGSVLGPSRLKVRLRRL